MATEKQTAANRINAQKSTGPVTPAGKAASAANAMTHGMTARKYLTSDETWEEFEAHYKARRRRYPPDDPIVDSLVEKITLAYFRIDRGFVAEAETLRQGSLAEILVGHEKPMKHLSAYEASNRRQIKLLNEELDRYLSLLSKAGQESTAPAPAAPIKGDPVAPSAANDMITREARAPTQKNHTNGQSDAAEDPPCPPPTPASPADGAKTNPIPPACVSEPVTKSTSANQKTKPISTGVRETPITTTSPPEPLEPAVPPKPSSSTTVAQPSRTIPSPIVLPSPSPPPKPLIQTNFDIPWNSHTPPRR